MTLLVDKEDIWIWNLEKSNAYTVRSAYNCQTAQHPAVAPVDVKMLWQKNVPLKVVVFAWCLFQNRLPTKYNLVWRSVLNTDSCLCATGCGSTETVNHLILHCSYFDTVWNCILRWIGLSTAAPLYVSDHFTQLCFGGGPQVRFTILIAIWFATVWEIWKERNNRILNAKECSITRIVDKIKSLSFSWFEGEICSVLSQLP